MQFGIGGRKIYPRARPCALRKDLPRACDQVAALPVLPLHFGISQFRLDDAKLARVRRTRKPMPKLNRDGVNIHYEVHGDGRPLILTHGYSSTSSMWEGQIAAFSRHYKLVLWDMRGHGQSDYPDDPAAYSEALTVADIAALLDKVGARQAIVGGLSLGGYMSLAFYRSHPERVRALLIIDTGPGFKKDEARQAWNKRALE